MFVAADSADTGKSRLWKPSRGPGRWARVPHYSVIPLKLRSEKAKLWMPTKLLISADRLYVGGTMFKTRMDIKRQSKFHGNLMSRRIFKNWDTFFFFFF